MENKTQILLIGIKDVAPFQDIRDVLLNYCDTAQEALELFVEHEFDILICNYQLPDENAVNLNESIQTFLNFYPKHSEKDTKLLAIINNEEEKKHCEENNLSYYPANSDIIPLISKLIDIAYTSTTQKKFCFQLILMNYLTELTIIVDS